MKQKKRATLLFSMALGCVVSTLLIAAGNQESDADQEQELRTVVVHEGAKTYVWHLTAHGGDEVQGLTVYSVGDLTSPGMLVKQHFDLKADDAEPQER